MNDFMNTNRKMRKVVKHLVKYFGHEEVAAALAPLCLRQVHEQMSKAMDGLPVNSLATEVERLAATYALMRGAPDDR